MENPSLGLEALTIFETKQNNRGHTENFAMKQHISVEDLKRRGAKMTNIHKTICDESCQDTQFNVPNYPRPVEFHVSSVSHVTDLKGLEGILNSGGFKDPFEQSDFSWWSLQIGKEEIQSAEMRYLQKHLPNNNQEKPFLEKFTTSPAFKYESRYGNYRFTFPLSELLQRYKKQFCGENDLKMSIFKTAFYRQEIMYAVVVHSAAEEEFINYPPLQDSEWVHFDQGEIIWQAQAICKNHSFVLKKTENNTFVANEVKVEYYLWDHVSLAFYLPGYQTLTVPKTRLKETLSVCELDQPCLAKDGTFTDTECARREMDKLMQSLE